jgi:hypothetical protein
MHECVLCGNWFDTVVYKVACPYCKVGLTYLERRTVPIVEDNSVPIGIDVLPFFREVF